METFIYFVLVMLGLLLVVGVFLTLQDEFAPLPDLYEGDVNMFIHPSDDLSVKTSTGALHRNAPVNLNYVTTFYKTDPVAGENLYGILFKLDVNDSVVWWFDAVADRDDVYGWIIDNYSAESW